MAEFQKEVVFRQSTTHSSSSPPTPALSLIHPTTAVSLDDFCRWHDSFMCWKSEGYRVNRNTDTSVLYIFCIRISLYRMYWICFFCTCVCWIWRKGLFLFSWIDFKKQPLCLFLITCFGLGVHAFYCFFVIFGFYSLVYLCGVFLFIFVHLLFGAGFTLLCVFVVMYCTSSCWFISLDFANFVFLFFIVL